MKKQLFFAFFLGTFAIKIFSLDKPNLTDILLGKTLDIHVTKEFPYQLGMTKHEQICDAIALVKGSTRSEITFLVIQNGVITYDKKLTFEGTVIFAKFSPSHGSFVVLHQISREERIIPVVSVYYRYNYLSDVASEPKHVCNKELSNNQENSITVDLTQELDQYIAQATEGEVDEMLPIEFGSIIITVTPDNTITIKKS